MSRDAPNPPPAPHILRGHASDVQCAAFDPRFGADVLETGDADGALVRWDVPSRREISRSRVHGPSSGTLAIASIERSTSRAFVSGDASASAWTCATQGRDGSVKFWRRGETREAPPREIPERAIRGETYGFCRIASDGCGLIARAACSRGSLVVERAGTGERACACRAVGSEDSEDERAGVAFCVAFVRSTHLVAGYEDGTVVIWALNFETGVGEIAFRRRTHAEAVLCVDVDAAGEGFVTGGADGALVRYAIDVSTSPLTCEIVRAHAPYDDVVSASSKQPGVSACSIRSDGKIVASGCWDGKIRVYEYKVKSKGRLLAVLKHHESTVTAVLFAPDDSFLVSTSRDGAVALWPIFPPTVDRGVV